MTKKKRGDRIGALAGEAEALAKRLGADIRKRARQAGVEKGLRVTADRLCKLAATVAAQVEKYAHELREELEGGATPTKRSKSEKRKKPARPTAKRKRPAPRAGSPSTSSQS